MPTAPLPDSPSPDDAAGTNADPATFEYDRSVPLDAEVTRVSTTRLARVERLRYRGADGEEVPAILSLPTSGDAPYACVLLGHGLRGDKHWPEVFDLLAQGGFAGFAIDARYHGERRDHAALQRLFDDPSVLERMLRETVIDMRRGIDYLETRPECDPERIGYIGASMGGFLGTMLAGVDDRVQAPVFLVSGADWRTMLDSSEAAQFRDRATQADIERARALLDPIDPVHWVGLISPRPVLMVAGDADRAVPPASARALHDAAGDPKTVIWYRGGHGLPGGAETRRIMTSVAGWLFEHLGRD